MLPKTGKDLRWLKNWRPLSLLNTDYKILAKIFARRLQVVLPNLIDEDQVAYIKGRYIGENIRKIVDIFEYTDKLTDPGIALFLDFEKAFDTISWQYLYKTLKYYNFGKNFIQRVQVMYNQPLCCVTNNGHASESFQISRGIPRAVPCPFYFFF